MQAIIDNCKAGALRATPALVISNNTESGALARARREGIASCILNDKTHPSPDLLDQAILDALLEHSVDIVVLAGYMKKLGPRMLAHFSGAILNIHPALLPRFGGRGMYGIHVHEAVLAAGEKESGVTVHLVDGEYDTGRTLAQTRVPVMQGDTPDVLAARVLTQEHLLYTDVLGKIGSGEITIPGYPRKRTGP
jgi:phosphoribosylglycinamide formyltransferase-1